MRATRFSVQASKGGGMIGAVRMGAKIDPQEPIFVAAEATSFVARCDYCVYEKNAPEYRDRAWAAGEGPDDVTGHGELPFGVNRKWARCAHGHAHLVLREGSDEARQLPAVATGSRT
jgi:hypothetical protein